jgi:hypothetical protein
LLCPAETLGGTFPGKGRLMWWVDKRESIGVGEGSVRSHAGVNVAGPPTLDRNAGSQRKKGDELGIIIREGRRVEREHVRHFNVIMLLNSITEMRGGVVREDSRSAQQTLELCSACGREVWGLGGALINERQNMVGCNSHEGG